MFLAKLHLAIIASSDTVTMTTRLVGMVTKVQNFYQLRYLRNG